jgi:hypothetical protein
VLLFGASFFYNLCTCTIGVAASIISLKSSRSPSGFFLPESGGDVKACSALSIAAKATFTEAILALT